MEPEILNIIIAAGSLIVALAAIIVPSIANTLSKRRDVANNQLQRKINAYDECIQKIIEFMAEDSIEIDKEEFKSSHKELKGVLYNVQLFLPLKYEDIPISLLSTFGEYDAAKLLSESGAGDPREYADLLLGRELELQRLMAYIKYDTLRSTGRYFAAQKYLHKNKKLINGRITVDSLKNRRSKKD